MSFTNEEMNYALKEEEEMKSQFQGRGLEGGVWRGERPCEPREGVPAELSSSPTPATAEEPWWERGRVERSLSPGYL